ncbi:MULTISPECIES: 3-isopropylmalate dehydratase small subunit [unclassified Thermosynechococcus]|uniref:3-isopropylmalate dehydratase small subunit n=1 Tax=unclassified Thermosynechococcus TaxID=2622553 RepID=UPI0026732C07|nr:MULTISPECIES: 3-isopropylmalate dehydratase small subunit [unclassified Thermosynechococcus]WKT84186.1 3-isopropylmalate dehydratase small subunit [Thermosynechococcus sp. HY596]WNC63320.1 3-isopropylmalate dehydratase small subunit [Thermosynechococcus sp. HY591]WNC65880.1 3-isopropylmalate dehydratase small subunit [Thermosynechococcus sp. HY593]
MSKIERITGRGLPLRGNDIDTDRIIPARFLRCVTFDGLGEHVFADDRQSGQHPFDLPQYQRARILVVNANFGCGSSREHAPQAIARWGIQAIVSESFAEIFAGNCLAMGVPCLTAAPEQVQALQTLLEDQPTTELTLDLQALTLTAGDQVIPLTMAESTRQMLLSGQWDACGQLLANQDKIHDVAARLPYVRWAVS